MAAYLITLISGNQGFGGYLSVDGAKAFTVSHDMTYELEPGAHTLTIYSTSNFERGAGKVQAFAYNHTSSSGAIMDTLERNSAIRNLGDAWEFDVMVEDSEMLEVHVTSKGSKIVATPQYTVIPLSKEQIAKLEHQFDEWRNTPIRSPKQIVAGAIMAFCGVFGFVNFLGAGAQEDGLMPIVVLLGIAAVGVLLIFLGAKKKIRRK